jgi:hypothetical protein
MRRYILPLLSLILVAVFVADAQAQVFRRPVRPAPFAPAALRPGFTMSPFAPVTFNNFTVFQTPRGALSPTVPGVFNPTTRTFMPSATGASSLISRGVFAPTTGTFVPSPTGNLVLTNRAIYNPSTQTFVPSATGNYFFATQGNLINDNGNRSRVFFGGLGLVNPLNPFSPYNPINQANFALLANYNARLTASYLTAMNPYTPYGNAYSPYNYSPYGYGGYANSYQPYGYGNSYSPSYTPAPYAYPSQSAASYSAPQAANAIPAYTGPAADNQQQVTLTAFGVPNENGRVQWPLAFRLLSPNMKRDVLDKLEAALQVLAAQGAAGRANPAIVNEAKDSVAALQRWLTENRVDLAEGSYREANSLLRRLDKTLQRMAY